jgi:hypothetical protein
MLYKKRIKDNQLIEFHYLECDSNGKSNHDSYYPGWLKKNASGELVYVGYISSEIKELYINSREVIGYKISNRNYYYD